MKIIFKINKALRKNRLFKRTAIPEIAVTVLQKHLREIKRLAVTRFMRQAGRSGSKPVPGKLTYRRGELARSITWQIFKGRNKVVGVVGTNKVYAAIHEYGGEIHAKYKPFLHFYIPHADKWVKVKRVVIPKRPYLQPAREMVLPKIEKAIAYQMAVYGSKE